MNATNNNIYLNDYRFRKIGGSTSIVHQSPTPRSGPAKARRRGQAMGRRHLSLSEHLHSEFPADELLSVTLEGEPIWSSPDAAHRVVDYCASFGARMAKNEIPEGLIEAWGYLAKEPGRWVDYLWHSPETYALLRDQLTEPEHSYVHAIATDDRATAKKLFPETRWAAGLATKIREARRDFSTRV